MRTRIGIAILVALVLAAPAWAATKGKTKTKAKAKPAAKATAPKKVTKQSLHFTLTSDLPQPSMDALLAVSEASLNGYRDVFGLSLYPNPNPGDKRMVLDATQKGPGTPLVARWDRKPAELHFAAAPALQTQTVFRLAREFAYPVAAYDNDAFNAGLMDYLGAHVVDYVAKQLDAAKVARPDDLVEAGGTEQFTHWEASADPGTRTAAAMLLYRVANAHGKEAVGKALRLVAMSNEPTWQAGPGVGVHPRIYKVAALCQQLVDLTNDGEIAQWFRENRFPSVVDPMNITAGELWGQPDEATRCQFLCARWGGNGVGLLDGKQVVLLGRFDEQKHPAAAQPQKSVTVEGLVLEPVPGSVTSVWFQPETKRIYITGKVKLASGAIVENGLIDVPAPTPAPSAPAP